MGSYRCRLRGKTAFSVRCRCRVGFGLVLGVVLGVLYRGMLRLRNTVG